MSPCPSIQSQREAEQRRRALEELLDDVEAGRRELITTADGQVSISDWDTTLAAGQGMQAGCALAALAEMDSWAVESALAQQGMTKQDVITAHGHSHGRGHKH